MILIFPFNNKLASFLESRFLTWEEKESNSRYLDKTIAMTPDLAVNALMLEMKSIAKRVSLLSREAIEVDFNQVKAFTQQSSVIKHLLENASNFIVSVESAQLSEETTQDLATMMRIEQYFLDCTQTSERLFHDFKMTKVKVDTHFTESHHQFVTNVLRFIEFGQDIQTRKLDAILSERTLLQQEHDAYKAKLLLAGTRGDISVHSMTDNLERLALINSVVQQWTKAMRSFSNINISEQNKLDGNVISNQGV